MQESEIKPGSTYTSSRWQGDRKVVRLVRQGDATTVHYVDLRTMRTGNAPLAQFAASAQGSGLVANL